MLVLSRRTNETVLIDGTITVEVLKIRGNRVLLGFDAPPDVRIFRLEAETRNLVSHPTTQGDIETNETGGHAHESAKTGAKIQGDARLKERVVKYQVQTIS